MKNYLLGAKLTHSYSEIIHNTIINNSYEIYPVAKEKLKEFFLKREFGFVNVTIPYKEEVIKYLDEISEEALKIGAVNYIYQDGDKLVGDNTDYYGFKHWVEKENIDFENKLVFILGSGGTSKMVRTYLEELNCFKRVNVKTVSRTKKSENIISYSEALKMDPDIIINTTPVGMFPNINESVIDLSSFRNLKVVLDCVYNPFRTRLMQEASNKNIKALGALDMLIYQAFKCYNLEDDNLFFKIKNILMEKQNIVLIGMPGSGKSTIMKALKEKLTQYDSVDTDELIESKFGKITEIFASYGEVRFREIEKEVINKVALKTKTIISVGGGAILDEENVKSLKANGLLFFIDRKLESIEINNDRPLMKNSEERDNLYKKRINAYINICDYRIQNNSVEEVIQKIIEVINR